MVSASGSRLFSEVVGERRPPNIVTETTDFEGANPEGANPATKRRRVDDDESGPQTPTQNRRGDDPSLPTTPETTTTPLPTPQPSVSHAQPQQGHSAVLPPPPKTGRWTKREDEQLRATIERFEAAGQPKDWKVIAKVAFNGSRSDAQCLERWERVLKLGLVKGPWTPEEDDVVRRAVEQSRRRNGNGDCNWAEVAKLLPGRLTKQVRERWQNHLNPALVKSPWTEEEDYLLVSLQAVLGNRWNEIARAFQGRSENAIKNRWNSKQRRTLGRECAVVPHQSLAGHHLVSASSSPPPQETLHGGSNTNNTTVVEGESGQESSSRPQQQQQQPSPAVLQLLQQAQQHTQLMQEPLVNPRPSRPIRNVCRNINFHKALVKATGNDPEINEAAAILVNKVSRDLIRRDVAVQ